MSDDLVERLQAGSIWGRSVQDTLIEWMKERKQAADRIEELEAKGLANRVAIMRLEAKLAKAVELALEECPFRWGTPNYDKWWHHRRTNLSALKGEDDG